MQEEIDYDVTSLIIDNFSWNTGEDELSIVWNHRPFGVFVDRIAGSSKFAIFGPYAKEVGFIVPLTMLEILGLPQRDENDEDHILLALEAEILNPVNTVRPTSANKAFMDFSRSDPEGRPLLIPFSRTPRAQWVSTTGGSGSLVFSVMDDSKCSLSGPLLRKQIWLYGKSYSIAPYFAPSRALQCMKCNEWGHATTMCKAKVQFCEHCSLAHLSRDHDKECAVCLSARH